MSSNVNGALCLPGVNCGTCLNSTYCSSCWPGTGMTINRTCVYCSNYFRCSSCNGDIPSQCYACNTYFNLTINNTCDRAYNCIDPYCNYCPNSLS